MVPVMHDLDPPLLEGGLEGNGTEPRFVHAAPSETEAPEARRERAPFALRLIAFAIDLLVLGVMAVLIFVLASAGVLIAEAATKQTIQDPGELVAALFVLGILFLTFGYFARMHTRTGQTLGKAAMHIRVQRTDGVSLGGAESALRTFGYLISALPLGLGFLLAMGPSRRALHDLLAGSEVVRDGGTR
jgi:uncharacterized RDD family membrane protein YckC